MDRPPTRYPDPRTSNPLNKAAGIKLFRATLRKQSQGLQRTRGRYRSEVGPDASRPADLNRPEKTRESSKEHQHNRFLENSFEHKHESKSMITKQPLRVSNQGQVCNHQHSSEQKKHNNTKQKQQTRQRRTSNPMESRTKIHNSNLIHLVPSKQLQS